MDTLNIIWNRTKNDRQRKPSYQYIRAQSRLAHLSPARLSIIRSDLNLNHHLTRPTLVTIGSSTADHWEQGDNLSPPSAVIPATRPHSDLSLDHDPGNPSQPDPDSHRPAKRQRLDASSPTMRLNSADTPDDLSPDPSTATLLPGPSSSGSASHDPSGTASSSKNGHTLTHANGNTNGYLPPPPTKNSGIANGSHAQALGKSISRVNIPGTNLYDDSNVNRQEFVRFVVQALRDVGYM